MTSKAIITFVALIFLSVLTLLIWLRIGFGEARKHTTGLPNPQNQDLRESVEEIKIYEVLSNGFSLAVNDEGRITVKDLAGNIIIGNIWYYSSYVGKKAKWGLNEVYTDSPNDTTIIISGEGSERTKVKLILTTSGSLHRLDIGVNTAYQEQVEVLREALIFEFGLPVSEVFKKNRKSDNRNFSDEYWLQRQGVLFRDEYNSAFIYNTQEVSSLQLDTKNLILYANLEFSEDHPYINIPFQADKKGNWIDKSTAIYLPNTHRDNTLSFFVNIKTPTIPRIMLVPNGNLGGYVFTEHADGGTLASHRAVYFGSDTITKAKNAIGGFVGNNIPVTKSIFYCNPEKESYSSVKDDNDGQSYLDFLRELHQTGRYEICLHTPEGGMSDREVMNEALNFMKENFQSVTWIDHGMEYGDNNRECFFADGLNEDSQQFSADLWEKYGIRYFWSVAVEKIRESRYISVTDNIRNLKLKSAAKAIWNKKFSPEELNSFTFLDATHELYERIDDVPQANLLQPHLGEMAPTPLFWQNKTRTGPFYSWVTDYSDDYSELWGSNPDNKFLQKLRQIDQLVDQNGVYIDHGYYIRGMEKTDLTFNYNGSVELNPYFNNLLGYMAQLRDSGNLYISTIKDLIDYWILCENVAFEYPDNGDVIITNENLIPINGFSLAVSRASVLVDEKIPEFRRVGEDTVLWFDLKAGESVVISFKAGNERH